VVPLAMTTILLSDEILRLFAPEARAARDLLIVLTIARALEAVAGPATALLEVIGRRVLPAMNSVAGLALWLMASALLVPPLGALGMGLAVGIGMVVSSYLSVFQLIMSDSLRPFAPPFGRTALAAAMVALVLASLSSLLSSLPDPAQATVLVVAWLAGTWLALRLGLAREDVAALGRLGAVLRLRR
jgi:O-antigen/teichoic acid export membrane protein